MLDMTRHILDEFNVLLPLKVAKAEPYWGTFVRIECDDAHGNPVKIRSYLSDWSLRRGEHVIVTSDRDKASWKEPIAALAGSHLLALSLLDTHSLQLRFDSDIVFVVIANLEVYENTDSLLNIYASDRFNIAYAPEGGFANETWTQ